MSQKHAEAQLVPVDRVIIGERIRKKYGDIDGLCASIEARGLLQPIAVTKSMQLIAGERRLLAFKKLKRKSIPATIVDIDDILLGERDENEIRKQFTKSERVALMRAIEQRVGERQGQRTDLLPQNFGEVPKGVETAQYAAELAGLGNKETARQVEIVVDRAVAEVVELMDADVLAPSVAAKLADKPAEFQKAVAEKVAVGMKPTMAMREVKAQEIERAEIAAPSGKFRVIYADPPWSYGNTQPDYQTEQRDHYPVMSLQEICALPVAEWAAGDAVLFLWVTSPILRESFDVIKAWGFAYKASFIWDKVKHNMGHYNSVRHELLLVATRGSCMPDVQRLFDSVVTAERSKHSAKPAVFYDMIETLYTRGRRLEVFARQARDGWERYGYEAPSAAA